MNIIDVIKIVLKHKVLLFILPLLMAILAIVLTRNPKLDYETQAYVYTGIASGTSLDIAKKFDNFTSRTDFDNLINIIESRETQEEVAVRLLTQHLLLNEPVEDFISRKHFEDLKKLVPEEIYSYLATSNSGKSAKDRHSGILPKGVTRQVYEQSVTNLMELKNSSNDNFIYELLSYKNPIYSLKAISGIKVSRVGSSDLIKLTYKSEDPGISMQTLNILIEVCTKKYKDFKENGSDTVVKYFETQLAKAEKKLKTAEQELLKYKQENSIINYYEQSKAVAVVREDMEVAYKNKLAQLAGSKASKKRLEDKLSIQGEIEQMNRSVLEDKEALANYQYQIVMMEAKSDDSQEAQKLIDSLKIKAENLQYQLNKKVNKLYSLNNSIEGVPMSRMMPQWIDNLVQSENLEAEVGLMTEQSQEFLKEVKKYAPFGANIKRMEREIRVIEEEYLEILHGLNTAKIKYQDTQIASNLQTVDSPYFPLTPIPSKRKIIVIAIAFISFILILGSILLMEFFDNTLKNDRIASEKIGLKSMGMLPKISMSNGKIDMIRVQNRLMDFLMHNFMHVFNNLTDSQRPRIITVFSSGPNEGKTVVAGNISKKLKENGKKVLFLNHNDSKDENEIQYSNIWLYRFLGYQDPRVDYSHPFLENVHNYLDDSELVKYEVDQNYTRANTFKDLTFDKSTIQFDELDYVIVELPNILEQNYPVNILQNSDLAILVCRSNRLWSKADNNILNNIKELVNQIQFIINGVAIEQVETLLGEIPKKRSKARKKMKNVFQLQFRSKNNI